MFLISRYDLTSTDLTGSAGSCPEPKPRPCPAPGSAPGPDPARRPRARPAANPPDDRRPETTTPPRPTSPARAYPSHRPPMPAGAHHARTATPRPRPRSSALLHETSHVELRVPLTHVLSIRISLTVISSAGRTASLRACGARTSPRRLTERRHVRASPGAAAMTTTHTTGEVPPSRWTRAPGITGSAPPLSQRDENHARTQRRSMPGPATIRLDLPVGHARRHARTAEASEVDGGVDGEHAGNIPNPTLRDYSPKMLTSGPSEAPPQGAFHGNASGEVFC